LKDLISDFVASIQKYRKTIIDNDLGPNNINDNIINGQNRIIDSNSNLKSLNITSKVNLYNDSNYINEAYYDLTGMSHDSERISNVSDININFKEHPIGI